MIAARRFLAPFTALLLIHSLASAQASEGPLAEMHPWVAEAQDPSGLAEAIATNPEKMPVEFYERLQYGYADGSIRVMVALAHRDAAIERDMEASTSALAWYGQDPRFFGVASRDQVAQLLQHPAVSFVEPDYPITDFLATSTLDSRARSLSNAGTGVWSYDAVTDQFLSDVPGLGAAQATGRGITVAVTDSGIDQTHRDFSSMGCTAGPYAPCNSRIVKTVVTEHLIGFPDPSGAFPTTEVASGHGTHVAGTVGGNAYYGRDDGEDPARYGADGLNFGVAPETNLISVKNGDSQSAGLSLFGLQWQRDHAAEYGIRVSSNSWGCLGGCSFNGASTTAQLFRDLYRAGVLVVFAAGNDGGGPDGTELSGNSQSPYVLGVAAYDDTNHQLASFSSRGSSAAPLPDPVTWTPESEPVNGHRRPDIAAPGVSIWAARTLTGGTTTIVPRANINDVLGGGNSVGFIPYAQISGTSMAAPHVSGAAALLFGACPQAEVLDVMRALMSGANETLVTKTGGVGVAEPFEVGYGGLDSRGGIDSLLSQPVCGGAGTNTAPTASISGPSELDTGATGTFDGSASSDGEGSIVSYTWDFGDGATADGPVVEHAFAQAGTYEVRLTVTDEQGTAGTTTHTVTVVDPTGSIAGSVSDFAKRSGIAGATVDCGEGGSATTASDGSFTLSDVPVGDYICTASADGYRSESKSVTVTKDATTVVTFELKRGGGPN